jgi:hypothetical protein
VSHDAAPHKLVLCNGADAPRGKHRARAGKLLKLSYLEGAISPNVHLGLPDFVRDVYHLPDRILDLLELAAYVFAADRLTDRGSIDAVEFHRWGRSFRFMVRVRDHKFWSSPRVSKSLSDALRFMTGDEAYEFTFQPGHSTPPTNLFDREEFQLEATGPTTVMLFSGGLDSLAGAVDELVTGSKQVCLVSHRSQPGTTKTQDALAGALRQRFPGRVRHYRFNTRLRAVKAAEETQRTRAFLFFCIAFAIAKASSLDNFSVHENGVTSVNFPRRQDLMIGRASRTTHPQVIWRLQELLSLIAESQFTINLPFFWKTKAEIIQVIRDCGHPDLVSSTVSCSRTFRNIGQASHCGNCSQCVDRRIAVYASGCEDWDSSGIFANDIFREAIATAEGRTVAVDYLRQARDFATWNVDHFQHQMLSDLVDLIPYLPEPANEADQVSKVWELCRRHGLATLSGLKRIREIHDDPFHNLPNGSLLHLVSEREYLKEPVARLVASLREKLQPAFEKLFRTEQPTSERDLNDKLAALIGALHGEVEREHPAVNFACGPVIPDHTLQRSNLVVEAKYIRQRTPPSKASEGMAADLTKYPEHLHILFVVYDPTHAIADRERFRTDFESKGRCTVWVLP